MTTSIIRFLDIIMVGLVAGSVFGIWIGYNPRSFSVATYIEQQQAAIKALNTLMPILGLITTVLTIASAFLQKANSPVFIKLLIAALFLFVSGLITKLGNQPINSIIMTWNKTDTPANWSQLRDKWWMLHTLRTVTIFIAFCLIAWTEIQKD